MKQLTLLFFLVLSWLFLLPSCSGLKQSSDISISNAEKFDWLLGKWIRSNETAGRTTYEEWNKKGADYAGSSYTIVENDTVWKESFILTQSDEELYFKVWSSGTSDPTVFKVTLNGPNVFVCENPENDFPKKIEYSKQEAKIEATISGGGPEIDFVFERYGL